MPERVYRIQTDRPALWQNPTSLQIGVDPPLLSIDDIPDEAAPLIHALTDGISHSGLLVLARQLGVTDQQAQALVTALEPAMHPDEAPTPLRCAVIGATPARPPLANYLRACGVDVSEEDGLESAALDEIDGVIALACYVPDPRWMDTLAHRDLIHTPVVFSDRSVRIGPRVEPGKAPCLSCLETRFRTRHPHWLNIQSQLWGATSPLSSPRVVYQVAPIVAAIHGFVKWGLALNHHRPGRQLIYSPHTRLIREEIVEFDPECQCRGLGQGPIPMSERKPLIVRSAPEALDRFAQDR